MDIYKIEAKRELIQFEINGISKECTIIPLKNKQLLEIQMLSEKLKKMDNLRSQKNPKTKEAYTEDELAELEKSHGNRINDIMLKESLNPPFTSEDLDEIETPTLLSIMQRILILNGLEEMMDFQQRVQGGQTPSKVTSPQNSFDILNRNPARKIT